MSEREVPRVEVLNEVHSGRRTVTTAASLLSISERQAYRLLSRYQENGGFLPAFMQRYNERFSVPAARTQDLHRPLRTTTPRLNDILCHPEQRYIGAQLTFHYDRKQIILEQTEVAKGLEGRFVELFDFWDRPLEIRWRGRVLPYRVFSKDQRVSQTAIVENKRLGHALAIVKAQQGSGSRPR